FNPADVAKCPPVSSGQKIIPGSVTAASSSGGVGETLRDAKELFNTGTAFYKENKFSEALERYQRALEIQELLAPESLDVAASYNNIGSVYQDQGKPPEALELYQRSLAIRERLAPESLDVAASYNNIGLVYDAQG